MRFILIEVAHGSAEFGGGDVCVLGEPVELQAHCVQSFGGGSGERQPLWCFFFKRRENNVAVGASEAKGVHAGEHGSGGVRPWGDVLYDVEHCAIEVDGAVVLFAVQAGWYQAMFHGEDDLDQSGDAGA